MSVDRAPIALTREVADSLGDCLLTHLERRSIDVARARDQHRSYCEALAALGCEVHSLPAEPALPDSVFVEDTAVVTDELAVLCRPGAPARRPEVETVAAALGRHRPLARITAPATLDGGDVVRHGRRVWVGLSSRSSPDGVEQLAAHLAPHGYQVSAVEIRGCLHLKSAATAVGGDRVLVNPAWVDPGAFTGLEPLEVDAGEPFAANALALDGSVVYSSAFPATAARLEQAGIAVTAIDVTELAKAEGAVTCCSLLVAR